MNEYQIRPGVRQTVTERGWYTNNFPDGQRRYTACRFAVIGQQALGAGYDVPYELGPEGAPNIVYILQTAGDKTPANGSTMAQGQRAIREVFGSDAPWLFGQVSEAEFFAAIANGAMMGFAVDCSKLPRYLKNFIGYGYTGGHYMLIDAAFDANTTVDLHDPMYRPARDAKPRRVPWADVKPAIIKSSSGIYVTACFKNSAFLRFQSKMLGAAVTRTSEQEAELASERAAYEAEKADIDAAIAAQTI